jgi:hypothetical protein
VAGDRARGEVASTHIFYSRDDAGTDWHHEVLDHLGMSASGCSVTDINSDGRLDVVLIGSATANIKWYENLGPDEQWPWDSSQRQWSSRSTCGRGMRILGFIIGSNADLRWLQVLQP